MPFRNEHAARQRPPGEYIRFRRGQPEGWPKGLSAIWGITKDQATELQSVRADAEIWTVARFRAWLKDHDLKTDIEKAAGEELAAAEKLAALYECEIALLGLLKLIAPKG